MTPKLAELGFLPYFDQHTAFSNRRKPQQEIGDMAGSITFDQMRGHPAHFSPFLAVKE